MRNIAANISVLFRELPLLQRFDAALDAGFSGVELQFPYNRCFFHDGTIRLSSWHANKCGMTSFQPECRLRRWQKVGKEP